MTMTFRIDVQDRKTGQWRKRTVIDADSDNGALRSYGIAGTRPYLGQATSKSGKRFRAVKV